MLTKDQVIKIVNGEFDTALGAPGGELALERAEAMQYYLGEPYGNEEEGSSQVVTHDVEEVVDGIMPSLLRMFTTADNLVSFDAVGPEDLAIAEQESDTVNYTFFKENPAFEILWTWFFDALTQKNGIVKCYWDESKQVTKEEYENLNQFEFDELLNDDEFEVEEENQHQSTIEIDGNRIVDTVFDVKGRRTTKTGSVVVENIPPDEYRVSGDANKLNPSMARMTGHEREVTRSELIEMGFDKKIVDSLNAGDERNTGVESQQRHNKTDDQRSKPSGDDKSQEKVVLREGYTKVDMDGDGVAELKQTFNVGNVELQIDDIERQPFHVLCPHPLPHKHFGRSAADKVMDTQLVTSTLLRQAMDNIYRTNRPGHGIWEKGIGENTLDDLLTTEVGRYVRFKRPVNESYQAMTVPFTAAASFGMLEYFDKTKRDRTGIRADSEGLDPKDLKHVQKGVLSSANDTSKLRIEAIARIFAETGLKTLFLHIRELLKKHQDVQKIIELRGQFVPVKPSEWRERRNTTINIGLGIGTREQNIIHLDAIANLQKEMITGGGLNLTVTPKNVYNTAAEYVKNANMKNPGMFFTDPGDKPAPPPQKEVDELQQQQMQLEQRRQKLDADRNLINQEKLKLENQSQQLQHQREILKIQEKREERLDRFQVENEKLRNALSEMGIKLDVTQADTLIKRITAEAQAKQAEAQAELARANADKARIEAIAASKVEDDSEEKARLRIESDAKVKKTAVETDKVAAETRKTEAEIEKIRKEASAIDAEVKATEELMRGNESEETE